MDVGKLPKDARCLNLGSNKSIGNKIRLEDSKDQMEKPYNWLQ